ncbi:MAG: nicotinate phosphoribosyltransferase [Clostridia bacterium]|nr:nicotinate phosphoribosyltransferase [Clostridia bacterium]
MNQENYTLLCDYYELTMANGYFELGRKDEIAYFDVFFRTIPDGGGFAIFAGLEQLVSYVRNLRFTEEDIRFLRTKGTFSEEFLDYLRTFRFSGDIYSMREGTPIFPGEPILTVRAPIIEAQIIETFVLLTVNLQSLIATKANRIVRAAQGRAVAEFGSRRAQGAQGAILGARAAYIGGCGSTACTISDREFHIPASGTMAHSWVQMFPDEHAAFTAYCKLYPNNATLLVDTYNVLESGIPNAIRVFREQGITHGGIRIDSGDIAYLSKKARKMLDEAGLPNCRIIASNSLDEFIIRDLISQGAKVDAFGVGERLITAKSDPVFGCVYKLAAIEDELGNIIPKIKVSENNEKITNPSYKKAYRIIDNKTGQALADYLTLADEEVDEGQPLELFDPISTWKKKTVTDYTARPLHEPIFLDGECVYDLPDIEEIKRYCAREVESLWDEVTRFENPHRYYVDLSVELWNLKRRMLENAGKCE